MDMSLNSPENWMSELGIVDYNIIDGCNVSSHDMFTIQDTMTEVEEMLIYPQSSSSYPTINTNNSATLSFHSLKSPPSREFQLHQCRSLDSWPNKEVGNTNFEPPNVIGSREFQTYPSNVKQGTKRTQTTASNAPPDHIMAERKRREKLNQRFIALSRVIPGLKKIDKASILADAINYIEELNENVKLLEGQNKNKKFKSVVFVKKFQLATDYEICSCDKNLDGNIDQALPEIEAKVLDKDVLLRIHCDMQKGLLIKVLAEIEKLHLAAVSSNVLPFGNSTLDITIIAQMNEDFCMTVEDLVKELRVAFWKFM